MKTESVGKKIKLLRDKMSLEAQKLAQDLNVGKSTLSNWENDRRSPDAITLIKIANYFDVSVDYLLGNDNKKTDDTDIMNLKGDNIRFIKKVYESEMVKIPVLGTIKAGIPMFAEENIIDYEYVHQEELIMGEETFFLDVKGDSMINARIHEGDRVRIRKQNLIENNGEIYAVNVNGDEATLKRVYIEENGIRLISENPAYPSMFYPAKDIESGYVNIVGKAVEIKITL
ncbi:MAG: helix-turn-helix domain-containing protein [Paraclostridium sp.]